MVRPSSQLRCTCATPRRGTRRGREARREQLPLRLQPGPSDDDGSGGEPVPGGPAAARPAVGPARRRRAATSAPPSPQLGAAAVVPGRPGQLGPRARRRAAGRRRRRRPLGRDRRARAGARRDAARRAVAGRGVRLPGGAARGQGLEPGRVGRGDAAGVAASSSTRSRPGPSTRWARCSSGEGGADGPARRSARAAAARDDRPAAADDAQHRRGDVRHPDRPGHRRAGRRGGRLDRRRAAARAGRRRRRCCPPTSPRSARASRCPPTRCGSTSRCASRRTTGCSPTSRGCVRTCSTPSRPTPAASASTPPGSRRRWARIDPTNPESLQQALTGGMFEPEDTPEQKAALARLETALALVEGWVDEVVDAAATRQLPAAGALRETVRRRRATGGPAEQTFASLVGLELRPRRLREAAALWRRCSRRAARTAGKRSGRTPTCCRRPTTSTTRPASPAGGVGAAGPLRPRRHRGARRSRRRRPVRATREPCATTRCASPARLAARPDADQERAAGGVPRTPGDAPRRHLEGLRRRPTSRPARWCSTPSGDRVLLTLHRKGGFWAQSAGTASRPTRPWRPRRCARRTEESGIGGLRLVGAGPVDLDRHALSSAFGTLRRAPRRAVRRGRTAGCRAGRQRRVATTSRGSPPTTLPPGAVEDLGRLVRAAQVALRGEG